MTMQPGSDAVQPFAGEYARMAEGELLHLAAAYNSLTGPAQAALRGEFARRGMEAPIVPEKEEVIGQPLVTVRRYRDLSEAIVGRAMLDSAGIFCFLQDENFLRLDWGAAIALGGLRLQVRPEDVQTAEELLNQPIPEAIRFDGKNEAEYVQPRCPRCGSIDITFMGTNRSAALVSTMMVGIPLPLGGESWHCEACGSRWADDGDDIKPDPVE